MFSKFKTFWRKRRITTRDSKSLLNFNHFDSLTAINRFVLKTTVIYIYFRNDWELNSTFQIISTSFIYFNNHVSYSFFYFLFLFSFFSSFSLFLLSSTSSSVLFSLVVNFEISVSIIQLIKINYSLKKIVRNVHINYIIAKSFDKQNFFNVFHFLCLFREI